MRRSMLEKKYCFLRFSIEINDIIRQAAGKHPFDIFWGTINGSTPQQERQGIVDAFMEYDGPGLLDTEPEGRQVQV